MVEITVKAADSAAAMEEIEKRLGADAMIISTNRVDGQIEIVATNDDPSKYQKTKETLVLDENYRIKGFSDVLNSKLSADDKPLKNEFPDKQNEILENAEKAGVTDGRNPNGLAAAAVYIACKKHNVKTTQREIAHAADITELILRQRKKEIVDLCE